EEDHDTLVDHAIINIVPLAPRRDDSLVEEALELVRNGLRLHFEGVGQIRGARLVGSDDGVKDSQPCVVGQNLKEFFHGNGLLARHRWPLFKAGLRRTTFRWLAHRHDYLRKKMTTLLHCTVYRWVS